MWWKYDGRYYPKNFWQGIKNLWRWKSVIWKDRDWDHDYIYEILAFKLKNQADCLSKTEYSNKNKRDVEIIRTCVRLIEKQQSGWYDSEYIDYFEADYDFVPIENVEGYSVAEESNWFEVKTTVYGERFDEYFAKYPRQYKRVKQGQLTRFGDEYKNSRDKKTAAMEISYENQKRSRKLLFKILEQNIERWWN